MALRYFVITISLIFLGYWSFGQPVPCEEPPAMTSFCADACIICDIDGFTGRHESGVVGEAPSDFCTFVVHNAQWIAFIAGSENLEVQMSVSNCDDGIGLEFALYESTDCQNFNLISNCFGGMTQTVGPGSSGVISNNTPLVIGQYYYIVMDGALGDNCDWTFRVLEGSTQVDPLTSSGVIQGDNTVCPGLSQQYFVDPPIGATDFEWTINGVAENTNEPILDYTFPENGVYNICVTAKNACDEGPPNCFQVLAESIPVTTIDAGLCEGDSFEIANTVIYQGGFYEFDLLSEEGCDSIVTLELTEIVTPLLNLEIDICDGDTLYIGNTPYTTSGTYQEILISSEGCDSIVNLDLFTIVCNITGTDTTIPVVCNGEASGQIDFYVENGTPPFTYTWQELNGAYSGSGTINAVGTVQSIQSIPRGTYLITINDGFGNTEVIISEVTEPDVLMLELLPSDYNGVNVTCADSNDGSLNAIPSGGLPAYTYSWNTGQMSSLIDQLPPGSYAVMVTDMAGCTATEAFEMTSPEPILLIGEFIDPDCSGLSTGTITAVQTLGGAGDYSFSLDGLDFSTDQVFDSLPGGMYTLTVMDANACSSELSGELIAPQIPEIDLGDNYEIALGDPITLLPAINNINIDTFEWTSNEILSCYDCLEPDVFPFNTAYYSLSVTSEDACTTVDTIFIGVKKYREIYVPNIFSPNFDGFNDYFTVFGGQEVAGIKSLSVYNRWGALVFETRNIEHDIENLGWDGTFKGKDLEPGVYIWKTEILFIDGATLSYSDGITLVR